MSNQFKIYHADGSERVIKGYKISSAPNDAKEYKSTQLGSRSLPKKVDLRSYMTEIEAQEDTNSCVANAAAGAYEYLLKRHLEDDYYDVSRLFIYYNARYLEEEEDDLEDEGCYVNLAIDGLREYGVCSEETWPFDEDNVNEEPSDEAYEEGESFLVEDVEFVPTELDKWKSCLAEGNPIIFGLLIYNSFDQHRKKGLVPFPGKKEKSRESHGGHVMLCVGYSDVDNAFIVRNSWGDDWGDDGYCYIPYRYIMNEEYNFGDSWIIKRLENFELDEDTWEEDDESVLTDYETELDEMSDEDYEDMIDAMDEYPLEYRIALLFLYAADEDDDISDEEYDAIAEYMKDVLDQLGVDMSAKKILRNAMRNINNEDLLDESVELMGEYLSEAMLATIITDLEEVISEDDLSEDEENFIDYLIEEWEIDYDK